MAKPIFIIRFPNSVSPQRIAEHKEALDKHTKLDEDYHVLIMKDHSPTSLDIRFEILNCSDMTETRWNNLIDMVMDDLDPDRILRRESEELLNKVIIEMEIESDTDGWKILDA